jgi:hypothetical protein
VSLTPTPLVATFSYNAIGNLTFKSDVGAYNYPAPGQPRPHGVTSVTGGSINATFTYDAKGNLVAGNGLTVTYTASNKAKTITRGTATVTFEHDPEHQRFAQSGPSGVTLYLSGMGVLAERFGQLGGPQRWTNYLMAGGRLVGIQVENADETTLTRWFHTYHLGSIAVITDETGAVTQRLSYDAWGLRRHPDGTPDPAGAIQSESTRGFTGHEHLAEVGLNPHERPRLRPAARPLRHPRPDDGGPVLHPGVEPVLVRRQLAGQLHRPLRLLLHGVLLEADVHAIGRFFRQSWGAIVQIAATAICTPVGLGPVCGAVAAAVVTGITSGDLGLAIRAGITAEAFTFVGNITGHQPTFGTADHVANIAGHALVGCASSVAQGGRCGPGALSGAVGSFASPLLRRLDYASGSCGTRRCWRLGISRRRR